MGNYTVFQMFQNPRRGMQARNFTDKWFENSRSRFVFRTDIFRKLTLGAPEDIPDKNLCSQATVQNAVKRMLIKLSAKRNVKQLMLAGYLGCFLI